MNTRVETAQGPRRLTRVLPMLALALTLPLAACGDSSLTDAQYLERAQAFVADGDRASAMIEARNALQQNPENAEARLLRGKLFVKQRRSDDAISDLRRAESLGGSSPEIPLNLMRAYHFQNNFDELLAVSMPDEQSGAVAAEVHYLRGHAHLRLARIEEARQHFEQAMERDPQSEFTALGQAYLAVLDNRGQGVDRWLDRAQSVAPDLVDTYAIRGDLALRQPDYARASQAFSQAVKLAPGDGWFRIAYAIALLNEGEGEEAIKQARTVLGGSRGNPAANYIVAAANFLEGDNRAAVEYSEIALTGDPDHASARLVAGLASYNSGLSEKALGHLRRFDARAPGLEPIPALLAELNRRSGAVDDGILAASLPLEPKKAMEQAVQASVYAGMFSRDPEIVRQVAMSRTVNANSPGGISGNMDMPSTEDAARGEQVAKVIELVRAEQMDEALDAAAELRDRWPESGDGATLTGLIHSAKGDMGAAEQWFVTALQDEPGHVTANHNLAVIAVSRNEIQKARGLYQGLLEIRPNHYLTMMRLAELEARANNTEVSAQWLRRAIEDQPRQVQPRAALAALQLRSNQPADALTTLEPVLEATRDNPEVLFVLGRAQIQTGDTTAAVGSFARLASLVPDQAQAHNMHGQALAANGDKSAARDAFARALAVDDTNFDARVGYMVNLLDSGDIAEGRKALNSLRQDFPDNVTFIEAQGRVAVSTGEYAEAADLFAEAVARDPNSSRVALLARAQSNAGSPDDGMETMGKWFDENPDDLGAAMTLADLAVANDAWDLARRGYRRVLDSAPGNVVANNNLAWVLLQEGELEEALTLARRANAEAPDAPAVMDTLALVLLEMGQYQEATGLFRQAVSAEPANPEYRFHLAKALNASGNRNESRELLEQLLAEDSQASDQEKYKALLDSI